jgi:DNA-directed RNA polymerase subunit M/transcription elongation factor TFIIS
MLLKGLSPIGRLHRSASVCNAQIFLTLVQNRQVIHKTVTLAKIMRHHAASPASSLPSLMMPCPVCAGRMVYHGRRPISADVEDTIYACKRCGAELIRTSVCKTIEPDTLRPAAA